MQQVKSYQLHFLNNPRLKTSRLKTKKFMQTLLTWLLPRKTTRKADLQPPKKGTSDKDTDLAARQAGKPREPGVPVSPFTCALLLLAPLLFVSFSFPKEISCRIQCAPVLGDSGWTYTLLPREKPHVSGQPTRGALPKGWEAGGILGGSRAGRGEPPLPCMLLSALPQVTHLPPWKRQWLGSASTTSTKTL